jgi:hypothetical protein
MIQGMKMGIGLMLGLGVALVGALLFALFGGGILLSLWAPVPSVPRPTYTPPPTAPELAQERLTAQEAIDLAYTQAEMAAGPRPWTLVSLVGDGAWASEHLDPTWPRGRFATREACQATLHEWTAPHIDQARAFAATRHGHYHVTVIDRPDVVRLTTGFAPKPMDGDTSAEALTRGLLQQMPTTAVCFLAAESNP